MSSPTQTRPVVTLYPSSQEDVNAYIAAIRLASTVRNSMDAPKAGVDTKEAAVDADSYSRHRHKFPPPPPTPANLTTPGKHETNAILNKTSSAYSASDITKAGLVRPHQDSQSSSRRSMSIVDTPTDATLEARKPHHGYFPPPDPPMSNGDSPILEDTAAGTPTDTTLEARKPHHGNFPPPEPPIGSTQAPPGKPRSRRTGPIPINNNNDGPNGIKWYGPGDIPPQCQLYATNTETNNDTFAVCPVTRRTSNTAHTLTSHQLPTGDTFHSHILAIRDTAMCEAPTGFEQQLACGNLDGWFALVFFILFWMIGLAWVIRRKYNNTRNPDEENGTATWPRLLHNSTHSPEANAKPRASNTSTNTSEAKLREELGKAWGKEHRLDERLGAEQYESAAWRSASRRAARARVEGKVGHDAGPVAVLPNLSAEELPAYHPSEPLPPSLWSTGFLG